MHAHTVVVHVDRSPLEHTSEILGDPDTSESCHHPRRGVDSGVTLASYPPTPKGLRH